MAIEDLLKQRTEELESIQLDVEKLNERADRLKDAVREYNELKQKAADLRKKKNTLNRDLNIVIGFLKTADESYLDNIYPLFGSGLNEQAGA